MEMAPRPPPGLMDDLIGEILLGLPPEDPGNLVRASVVCKPWRRLILSDPGFPRRYQEFHGSPPLLGFLHKESYPQYKNNKRKKYRADRRFIMSRFIPIKRESPIPIRQPKLDSYVRDCRHGRVLLDNCKTGLIVWDPITNSQHHIGLPNINDSLYDATAAVLCTAEACDHFGWHAGHSLVVFVEIDILPFQRDASASAVVYSTETGTWKPGVSSVHLGPIVYPRNIHSKSIGSSLLAEDAIYFILEEGRRILKYDLAGRGLSLMSPPPVPVGNMVTMKAESGGLGSCSLDGHSLHLWAWQTCPGGTVWEKGRVIQIDIGHLSTTLNVVDFAEGAGSIFVRANNGFFAVELKSGQSRKIGEGGNFKDIFPFMTFYTPDILLAPDCKQQ